MSFIDDYFLTPIQQNGWFNPVNTAVYALILLVAVYGVHRLLTRMKIPIDRKFAYAVLPFIFWGSSTRVLHDAAFAQELSPALNAFYDQPFFPTPGSYFITFGLALTVLLMSLGLQRVTKRPYWQWMLGIGVVLDLVNVVLIPWSNVTALIEISGLTVVSTGVIVALAHFLPKTRHILTPTNQAIIAAHLLDAAATAISLAFYGYSEQHVLPRTLIPLFGPFVMFPLKLVVVIPVLWLIDRSSEDSHLKNFLKLVVFILGAAPGLRDTIRLVAGV